MVSRERQSQRCRGAAEAQRRGAVCDPRLPELPGRVLHLRQVGPLGLEPKLTKSQGDILLQPASRGALHGHTCDVYLLVSLILSGNFN